MKKLLFSLFILPLSLFAQSPGGISAGLRWWLKADAGVLNNSLTPALNGEAIEQWNDQSTIVNNATQLTGANQPIFQTNSINGYPSFLFSGDQFLDATSAPNLTASFYFFIVFKQTSFVSGATTDAAGTYIIDRTTATTDLTSFKMVNTDKYFFQERDGSGNLGGPVSTVSATTSSFVLADYYRTSGTGYGLFINGANNATSGDNAALTGPTIRIGRHATTANGGLRGNFAEIAVYNTTLTTANRRRIESYLALKYGITLDQTVATNYVSSTGATIYPATTTHDLFDNDIAGIGFDNGSGLNQSASQSQNANSMLRISSPAPALVNGDFMLWGHNSPSIGNSNNTPGGFANRLSRVWRIAKTAGVGTVSVSFDLTGLGIDLSDPTKFALLIDTDGNFSNATAYVGGRSIIGNTVSFTTAAFANNNYFTLATPTIPGPGGIGGALIWLRADKSVYIDAGTTLASANNQPVQQWNNIGLAAYNVSQTTVVNQPTYQLNVANNNPVLRFTAGAADTYLDCGSMSVAQTSDIDYTIVVRPSTTANAGDLLDNAGGYILDRSDATSSPVPRASLKLLTAGVFGYQEQNDAAAGLDGVPSISSVNTSGAQIVEYFRTYNVQYGILYNGALENTLAEADGPMTLPNLRIGSAMGGTNFGLNGDIAEVIFFNRTLTSTERNRIGTYLAIKYGVTLDQTSLTNYVASNGTVVYPATTSHSSYNIDIAGIGQDPVSSLVQTNSQSINALSLVNMQSPSNLNDFEYLIWGSDGGTLTTPELVDVGAPVIRRLSRVWRVAETNGDVGAVTVSFDLTPVPGAKIQSDLRLLIDRNGNGFADNDVAPLSGTLAGQIFTVTGINFQNGDYFTVGSTAITTPLPIQLTMFKVESNASQVSAQWTTETEINNDYFTLQRSKDGSEFELVTTIKGAGNSHAHLTYSALDLHPHEGLSYYRLKQTDYDGKSTFSKIKTVTVSKGEGNPLVAYPNPTSGSGFGLKLVTPTEGEVIIQVISTTGQPVHTESRNANAGTNLWSLKPTLLLPIGIYIIRVQTQAGSLVTKLAVKQD